MEKLVDKMKSSRETQRVLAVQKLGRIGRKKHVSLLYDLYRNGGAETQRGILEAMSIMPSKNVDEVLKRIIEKREKPDSFQAAEYLTKRGGSSVIPYFLEHLASEHRRLRQIAIQSLYRITGFRFGFFPDRSEEHRARSIQRWKTWWERSKHQSPESWWLMVLERSNSDLFRKVQAIDRLVEKKEKWVVPHLIRYLRSPEKTVRRRAIQGLEDMTLRRFSYRFDDRSDQREASVTRWEKWWARHRQDSRRKWLSERFQEGDTSVKRQVIRALMRSQEKKAIPLLLSFIQPAKQQLWQNGIRSLRNFTGLTFSVPMDASIEERKKAMDRWRQWWKDYGSSLSKDQWMKRMIIEGRESNRERAATDLGKTRNRSHVKLLIHFGLQDPSVSVREASIRSLRTLTGRTMGFVPEESVNSQRKAIAKWKQWLETRWTEVYGREQ